MVGLAGMYAVLCTKYRVRSLSYSPFVAAVVFGLSAAAAPPKVTHLFPAGGQRGQTVAVTAAGDLATWPVEAWVDRPGVKVTAEKDKGKFQVEISPDAGAGTYWLRFFNKDGAAALRPFIIGTLAETLEAEPNDAPDKFQSLEPRVVVNGKLGKSGDVDGFRVELKAGQTLVASLAANSVLGAPMDAMLQVCELVARPGATSPNALEAYVVAQNHDATGSDPLIAYTAPRDGSYLARVFAFPATPDSSVRFAGGDDYIYRLTLTTGPYIDHCLPLAAFPDLKVVDLGGWNLPAGATATVPLLSAETTEHVPSEGAFAWVWRPDAAGAIAIPRVEHFDSAGSSTSVPSILSGRLATTDQNDSYVVAARKNEKLRIRVAAKSIGFPTDPVVAVIDESGKTLAEADDAGRDDRDPQLDFTPPADGKYTIRIRDLAGRGDPRLVYCLSIAPATPDFTISLAADSFILEQGKTVEVPLTVTVRDGLKDPVEISARGLPAGVTAEPVKFVPSGKTPAASSDGSRRGRRSGTAAPAAPSVKLILKADEKLAAAGGTAICLEGHTAGENGLVRTARFPLNLPLAGQHHAVWLTVK